MFGVFKARSRSLTLDSRFAHEWDVNKLAGLFKQEDFAVAFAAGLHREQMDKIGTILDTYEVRPMTFEEAWRTWQGRDVPLDGHIRCGRREVNDRAYRQCVRDDGHDGLCAFGSWSIEQ